MATPAESFSSGFIDRFLQLRQQRFQNELALRREERFERSLSENRQFRRRALELKQQEFEQRTFTSTQKNNFRLNLNALLNNPDLHDPETNTISEFDFIDAAKAAERSVTGGLPLSEPQRVQLQQIIDDARTIGIPADISSTGVERRPRITIAPFDPAGITNRFLGVPDEAPKPGRFGRAAGRARGFLFGQHDVEGLGALGGSLGAGAGLDLVQPDTSGPPVSQDTLQQTGANIAGAAFGISTPQGTFGQPNEDLGGLSTEELQRRIDALR